jgi:uncharacterized protein YndB with AHSA1/START domain
MKTESAGAIVILYLVTGQYIENSVSAEAFPQVWETVIRPSLESLAKMADEKKITGGKTSADTDTFEGRFVELVPYEKIVEVIEFESRDPRFAGEMKITTTFTDTNEGTNVTILCEDIPAGIGPEDNETGSKQSLQKLAALVESSQ